MPNQTFYVLTSTSSSISVPFSRYSPSYRIIAEAACYYLNYFPVSHLLTPQLSVQIIFPLGKLPTFGHTVLVFSNTITLTFKLRSYFDFILRLHWLVVCNFT